MKRHAKVLPAETGADLEGGPKEHWPPSKFVGRFSNIQQNNVSVQTTAYLIPLHTILSQHFCFNCTGRHNAIKQPNNFAIDASNHPGSPAACAKLPNFPKPSKKQVSTPPSTTLNIKI